MYKNLFKNKIVQNVLENIDKIISEDSILCNKKKLRKMKCSIPQNKFVKSVQSSQTRIKLLTVFVGPQIFARLSQCLSAQ